MAAKRLAPTMLRSVFSIVAVVIALIPPLAYSEDSIDASDKLAADLVTERFAHLGRYESELGPREGSVKSTPDLETIVRRSIVNQGNLTRLHHVLAKARRGEPIVIGAIGGSITQATLYENRYLVRVVDWWRAAFPDSPVTAVNAGLSSTGTYIASHRAQLDLLDSRPDLALVEFAVNDRLTPFATETMEGLVRRILRQPQKPAIVMIFMMTSDGQNGQANHEPVGFHYGLPMLSFRDGLWPEVESGNLLIGDILADSVHPNDLGHRYTADIVTGFIWNAMPGVPIDELLPPVPLTPAPLVSDVYETSMFFNRNNLEAELNGSWGTPTMYDASLGPGWSSTTPGSSIEAAVGGESIGLIVMRSARAGIIEASIDNEPARQFDIHFHRPGFWYDYFLPSGTLEATTHSLAMELLSDLHPDSDGFYGVRLYSIAAAGRANFDMDGDGLPDMYELDWLLDPFDPLGDNGGEADPDGDGLSNLSEAGLGTDPLSSDTDGDGISDAVEVANGTDPRSRYSPVSNFDFDGDGIGNWLEPEGDVDGDGLPNYRDSDSNGDGVSDGVALALGLDPYSLSPAEVGIESESVLLLAILLLLTGVFFRGRQTRP